MALKWDTAQQTTSVTYSNNNQTVNSNNGNTDIWAFTDNPITPLVHNGVASYFEINMDIAHPSTSLSVGLTPSSLATNTALTVGVPDGGMYAVMNLNSTTQGTVRSWNYRGSTSDNQYLVNSRQFNSISSFSNDDRIGVLVEWGTPTSPFTVQMTIFLNGVELGTFNRCILREASTETFRFAYSLQATGNHTHTIIDDPASWLYKPTGPKWLQVWSSTIAAVDSADADTGYCRLVPPSEWNSNITTLDTPSIDYSADMLSASLYADAAGTFATLYGSTYRDSGDYYMELTYDSLNNATPSQGIGIDGGNQGNSQAAGTDSHQANVEYSGGTADFNIPNGQPTAGAAVDTFTLTQGDVIGVAFSLLKAEDILDHGPGDRTNTSLFNQTVNQTWAHVNGTWMANSPNVAKDNGVEWYIGAKTSSPQGSLSVGPWRPMFWIATGTANNTPTTVTANFGASAFAYTIPTGFTAWDDTAPPVGS